MGIALAVALLLLIAGEARAGKYEVAQCGWYVGADANWADSTGGAKFRQDAWCVPPAGQDPFDGAHMKSFTRDNQGTVSGTRFARWRWEAPAGTGISQVRGTWWHALHDGMEQRIGVGTWNGGFNAFATAGGTDTTPREFVAGFNPAQPALEDRLLCARAESKWCSLEPGSWSAIRALTITVQDDQGPGAGIGGDILAGGWRRGTQGVGFWGGDTGGGIRYSETSIDGARVNLTEYGCSKALIGGVWKATMMRPCQTSVSGGAAIDTTHFSDGHHSIHHCVTDFAGNVGCTGDGSVAIDNNAPAHPRNLALAGGEGWRRVDDFDFAWANPDQGPASPIWGAYWRITGPAGYDTGVQFAGGQNVAALPDRSVPRPGVYSLHLWLRDEAGNDNPASALDMTMRFDDVPPGVAFAASEGDDIPAQIRADVTDAHSGPAAGTISYRRLNGEEWDGAADQAAARRRRLEGDAGRPHAGPRARHLRLPGRSGRRRRQRRDHDAARRRHRDGDPQDAAAGGAVPGRDAKGAAGATGEDAPVRAAARRPRPRRRAHRALRRAGAPQRPPHPRRRRRHRRAEAARRLPALARRPRADRQGHRHHRRARRLRAAADAGALAPGHRRLRGRWRPASRPAGPHSTSGCAPASPSKRRRSPSRRGRRCGSAAGSAVAAPRSPGAASWSRSSTWRRPPTAGARCSSPAPTTAAASAPTTASATSAAPPRSASAPPPWPRSAGPMPPAPPAP